MAEVPSINIAKRVITRMVSHDWPMDEIVAHANFPEWADDLLASILYLSIVYRMN